MKVRLNQQANEKFLRGDALSDNELHNLICFYDNITSQLGQPANLASSEKRLPLLSPSAIAG